MSKVIVFCPTKKLAKEVLEKIDFKIDKYFISSPYKSISHAVNLWLTFLKNTRTNDMRLCIKLINNKFEQYQSLSYFIDNGDKVIHADEFLNSKPIPKKDKSRRFYF